MAPALTEAAKHNKLTIQNINHEGTISNYNVGQYDNSIVKINGGTFAYAPTKYTGDTVVSTGGDYYVGKQANDVLSNPNTKEVTVLQANGPLTVSRRNPADEQHRQHHHRQRQLD